MKDKIFMWFFFWSIALYYSIYLTILFLHVTGITKEDQEFCADALGHMYYKVGVVLWISSLQMLLNDQIMEPVW